VCCVVVFEAPLALGFNLEESDDGGVNWLRKTM